MEGNNNKAPLSARCSPHRDDSNNIEMQQQPDALTENSQSPDKHSQSVDCFPILFRRSKFFPFNPRFDSPPLEKYLENCFFPQSRRKFQTATTYVLVSCILWVIYFSLTGPKRMPEGWLAHIVAAASLLVISTIYLTITFFPLYSRHYMKISFTFGLLLVVVTLLRFACLDEPSSAGFAMTPVGAFSSMAAIVMILYLLLPLPLYLCSSLAIIYSILFEVLFTMKSEVMWQVSVSNYVLHICIHLVCMSVHIMTSVRKHATFLKIGQSTMARKQLREEKQLQEEMIHSLVPPNVAKEAMERKTNLDEPEVS